MAGRAEIQGDAALAQTLRLVSQRVAPSKMGAIMRRTGILGFRTFVFAIPVDTGRHRGASQVALNGAAVQPFGSMRPDKNGGPTIARGVAEIEKFGKGRFARFDREIAFVNNGPAIRVLNLGLFDPPNPGPSKKRAKGGRPIPGRTGRILVSGGYSIQNREGIASLASETMRRSLRQIARSVAAEPRSKHGGRRR